MIINSIIAGAGGGDSFEYDEEYTYTIPTEMGTNKTGLYIPFTPTQPFELFVYRVDAFEGDYRNYIRYVEILCDDVSTSGKVGRLMSYYNTSYAKSYAGVYNISVTHNETNTYTTSALNINSNGMQISSAYNFGVGAKYRAIVKYLPTIP